MPSITGYPLHIFAADRNHLEDNCYDTLVLIIYCFATHEGIEFVLRIVRRLFIRTPKSKQNTVASCAAPAASTPAITPQSTLYEKKISTIVHVRNILIREVSIVQLSQSQDKDS